MGPSWYLFSGSVARAGSPGQGKPHPADLGTEHSLDSRCVDELHGLVYFEEGLEAWRGRGKDKKGSWKGVGSGCPHRGHLRGLTCAGFKGWQHRHKHIVQEERAAVHSDGAREQPTEIADVAGGECQREHKSLPLEILGAFQLRIPPTQPWKACPSQYFPPIFQIIRRLLFASNLNFSCCLKGVILAVSSSWKALPLDLCFMV